MYSMKGNLTGALALILRQLQERLGLLLCCSVIMGGWVLWPL